MSFFRTAWRELLVRLGIVQRPEFIARLVTDHPSVDAMKPGVIYIVGGRDYQKWAYFRCPADQNEIVQLSLMTKRRPCWQITTDKLERPTIHPSVRQLDGSYAHFWVKSGRVDWCSDTGRKPQQRTGISI